MYITHLDRQIKPEQRESHAAHFKDWETNLLFELHVWFDSIVKNGDTQAPFLDTL